MWRRRSRYENIGGVSAKINQSASTAGFSGGARNGSNIKQTWRSLWAVAGESKSGSGGINNGGSSV